MPKDTFGESFKKGVGEFVGDMFGPMGIGPKQHDMKERMYPAQRSAKRRRNPKVREGSYWWRIGG